jgi:hypothetical protein
MLAAVCRSLWAETRKRVMRAWAATRCETPDRVHFSPREFISSGAERGGSPRDARWDCTCPATSGEIGRLLFAPLHHNAKKRLALGALDVTDARIGKLAHSEHGVEEQREGDPLALGAVGRHEGPEFFGE